MTKASAAFADKAASSRTCTFAQVVTTALAQGLAVAAWRLPGAAQLQVCISFDSNFSTTSTTLETSPFGFFFCPFEVSETQPNLFIQADLYFNAGTGDLEAAPHADEAMVAAFYTSLEAMQESITTPNWHTSANFKSDQQQTEEAFTAAVAKAVAAIQAEEMEKVVLSRNMLLPLSNKFDLLPAFEIILQTYPMAFVSLVSVPGAGTWLGASPEILVSIDQEQIFRTVALAGTQPATVPVSEAIWRQKEIEEQGMVERYILSCFKRLRLREYTEIGPRTIIAGNLMHLRTDFKVDLKEVDFPTLGTDMLQLLHPTSAICGLPKEPALNFILAHEGYNRSYYSGFLGPINSPDGTHLYVNLRCMQLLPDTAVLYAGAGITAESSPEKEWQETQHKMQTMRHVLANFE